MWGSCAVSETRWNYKKIDDKKEGTEEDGEGKMKENLNIRMEMESENRKKWKSVVYYTSYYITITPTFLEKLQYYYMNHN